MSIRELISDIDAGFSKFVAGTRGRKPKEPRMPIFLHEWQAIKSALDERNELLAQRDELLESMRKTIEENRHLSDGEDCTLRYLVAAIAKVEGGGA